MSKPKVLVHVCCAPDAAYVIGLLQETYLAAGFFSNSNIHPPAEYARRLEETRKVAAHQGIRLIEDYYAPARWIKHTLKHRREPEKGRRCDVCYALRLQRTARAAADLGCDAFTTVMSLSPWKKAAVLNRIGGMLGRRYGVQFLEANFKKKDGFRKSIVLSKELDLYRQDYCGCVYSRRERRTRSLQRLPSPPSSPATNGGIETATVPGRGAGKNKKGKGGVGL